MHKVTLRNLLFCFVFVVLTSFCNAGIPNNQKGAREMPLSFSRPVEPIEVVDKILTKDVNLTAVRLEDQKRELWGGPYRFAVRKPAQVDVTTDGTWEPIDAETLMWRLHVTSPKATSLSLGFTAYNMPSGGRLFVYSADGKQMLGPYTEHNNTKHHQLWTPLIYSDDIVVELTIPVNEVENLELTLGAINHGYRQMLSPPTVMAMGNSASCEINAACPAGDGWRDQIRSVALYYVTRADGTYQCTGTLINNTAQDGKPYFLTAFHCFDEYWDGVLADPNGAAASMVVYWNFQASTCSGTTGPENQTQTGAYFRAAYNPTDFTLVELDEMPPQDFNVYYAGWDRGSAAPSSGAVFHHPRGDLKKISVEYHPLSVTSWDPLTPGDGTHLYMPHLEVGTVEIGSSGSPIFGPNKLLAGQIHGGVITICDPPSSPLRFGRFYKSWTGGGTPSTRLSNWLDPISSGQTTLNGKNPVDFPSTDVPKTIPNLATITSILPISQTGTIIDLDVKLNITHSYDADLDVFLIAPDGNRVELFTDVGSSGDNFTNTVLDDEAATAITSGTAPFTGSYRPEGSLSVLDGKSITGTWTLEITDDAAGNTGTLNSWSLIIDKGGEQCPQCPSSENFETDDFSLFNWIHSGDANWVTTSADKYSGTYSAKAGTITHDQSTSLQVTLDCKSGQIKFYRKVSSESGLDWLRFYIDDVKNGEWSGTESWAQAAYPVTDGIHTFKWTYSKNGSTSVGSDTAWIDDIQFPARIIVGDFNCDQYVNFMDIAILASQWQNAPDCPSADIAPQVPDGVVDMLDLSVFVQHWLEGVAP